MTVQFSQFFFGGSFLLNLFCAVLVIAVEVYVLFIHALRKWSEGAMSVYCAVCVCVYSVSVRPWSSSIEVNSPCLVCVCAGVC